MAGSHHHYRLTVEIYCKKLAINNLRGCPKRVFDPPHGTRHWREEISIPTQNTGLKNGEGKSSGHPRH